MLQQLRIYTGALLSLSVLGLPSASYSDTFTCSDPPDKIAKVGVNSGNSVQITKDKKEKACSFSINGASVNSPPQARITEGINQFTKGLPILRELDQKNVRPLAYLLLAGAPVQEIPKEVEGALTQASHLLRSCIQDFFYGKAAVFESGRLKCTTWRRLETENAQEEQLRMFGVAVSIPTLEISLQWGDRFASRLFIPITRSSVPPR